MNCYASIKDAAGFLSSSNYGRRFGDDAFMICDLSEAVLLLQQWMEFMPRIRPFYAMKAGPHPPLVKVLQLEGAGIDCASQKEIDTTLEMGTKPEDIIYSNPNKQISHLLHAKEKNITLTVYDGADELKKIHAHYPDARLLLRLHASGESRSGAMNDRFGANLPRARLLIKLSKELGMNTIGISFHVGSPCLDPSRYHQVIKEAREMFDFAATLGMKFEMLNIGGGFEGSLSSTDRFKQIAVSINQALDELFDENQFPKLRIISEPGRYFCDRTFTLLTNIIAKRENETNVDYTINDGVCGSYARVPFAGTEYDKFEVYPLRDDAASVRKRSRLYGPTCAGFDIVKGETFLPNLEIGDWLIWPECGSYTFAMATSFNSLWTDVFYNISTKENRGKLDRNSQQNIDFVCEDSVTTIKRIHCSTTLAFSGGI